MKNELLISVLYARVHEQNGFEKGQRQSGINLIRMGIDSVI